METGNTYAYFALTGDDFDPKVLTQRLGVTPTEKWKKGDKWLLNRTLQFSNWEFSTNKKGGYILMIDDLVKEVVDKLFDKIDIIKELKNEFNLDSRLEIVMYIDVNEERSTPALGHNLKTIEFLYRTQTRTDVDIYTFNSSIKGKHISIVLEIYNAFRKGDIPTVINHLSDEVQWEHWADNSAQKEEVPWMQAQRGKAGAMEFFKIVGGFDI